MGVDRPSRPAGSPAAPIADRARGFAQLVRITREAAAPVPVHPGEHQDCIYSLAPLGVPRSAGITRWPVLLGGEATEQLQQQLASVCSQRLAAGSSTGEAGPHNPAHSGWAHGIPPVALCSGTGGVGR